MRPFFQHIFACCVLSSIVLIPNVAGAAEASVGKGLAAFHGDISRDVASPFVAIQASLPFAEMYRTAEWIASSYVGFDYINAQAKARDTSFPFEQNGQLSLTGFFLTPGICGGTLALRFCGSLGIGTLNVNSRANRQDYGTWSYEAAVKYVFYRGVFFKAAGKKIGDVEQQIDGRHAHFWLTSWIIALGLKT